MSTATSPSAISSRIAQRIADDVGPRKYAMWFDHSARFSYDHDDRTLRVAVPNRFVADWIGKHFRDEIHRAAANEAGQTLDDVDVDLVIDPAGFAREDRVSSPNPATPSIAYRAAPAAPRRRPSAGRLRHRLEEFVVGPANELAYTAAARLADEAVNDAAPAGPLFLHGGCGLGKTHLLQGVCRRVIDRDPQTRVHYATGEQFTNDYIAAVRSNKLEAFRRKMRRVDLLAVDDVHFIANKAATQQEFLHSFDQIELGGARVVLASDSHPKLIEQFSQQLVSRCVRGLVVQINPPDEQLRRQLVQTLAGRRGLTLSPGVIEPLAEHGDGSVREIEGLLAKLHAMASLNAQGVAPDEPIGRAMVERLLRSEAPDSKRRRVRYEHVLQAVAEELHVTPAQITGAGRHRHVVLARSLVVHLTRQFTSMSFPEIAAAMGRKNHSTVITAAQRMKKQIESDQPVLLPNGLGETSAANLVERLRRTILRG